MCENNRGNNVCPSLTGPASTSPLVFPSLAIDSHSSSSFPQRPHLSFTASHLFISFSHHYRHSLTFSLPSLHSPRLSLTVTGETPTRAFPLSLPPRLAATTPPVINTQVNFLPEGTFPNDFFTNPVSRLEAVDQWDCKKLLKMSISKTSYIFTNYVLNILTLRKVL